MTDFESDERDGVLFRFWIRAGSEFPGEAALAIARATTPTEYRRALTELAERKRINLPDSDADVDALVALAGLEGYAKQLPPVHYSHRFTGPAIKALRKLAGLDPNG